MKPTKITDTASMRAVTTKTAPVLVTARSSPARAGPPKTAKLSTPRATAFAAVSSAGSLASAGISAACADRTGVATIASTIASAYTRYGGAPRITPIAAPLMREIRPRFAKIRTCSRRSRSASSPANGDTMAAGTSLSRKTIPTAFSPPSLYA